MSRIIFAIFLAIMVFATTLSVAQSEAGTDKKRGPERWERKIQAFEKSDAKNPPPKNAILFVGSSSIVRWDVDKYFPDMEVINRGFGGSQMSELVHFTKRIVLPYEPRIIVVYEGDNDINAGKAPKEVVRDFEAFIKMVQAKLPNTKIIFLAVKPSLRRWKQADLQRRTNRMLEKLCASNDDLEFVDVFTPMLTEEGKPRKGLFVQDGLHLNPMGYRLWTGLVKPHLEKK